VGKKKQPKTQVVPGPGGVRQGGDPDFYLREKPVWRFQSFDWEGSWGISACGDCNWRKHIEQHLASFETMTWAEIQQASGGRSNGNNSHHLDRENFTREARKRLDDLGIYADVLFSLRLESTVRVYGVREGACLRIIWIDPYHIKGDTRAAYDW
jgi:hypothetical protein